MDEKMIRYQAKVLSINLCIVAACIFSVPVVGLFGAARSVLEFIEELMRARASMIDGAAEDLDRRLGG
jgi:hypothetical protein